MSNASKREGLTTHDRMMAESPARDQCRHKGARFPVRSRLVLVRVLATLLGVLCSPAVVTEVAGDETATFAAGRAIDSEAVDVYTIFAADLDGDGDLDIIAGLYYWNEVFWYENVDGAGTFPERYEVASCCDRASPSSITAGDLNGDGSIDVVVAYDYTNEITWFSNSDGQGSFAQGVDITTDAEGVNWVTVADIDGDGDLDVVSSSFYDDRVTWYENTDGEGTFAVGIDISETSDGPTFVLAADLDSDGDLDIVGTSFSGDLVTWFENSDGEGEFSRGVNLSDLFFTPRSLAAADLDGDLDLDVIAASEEGDVVWFENTDGAGTFADAEDIGVLNSATSVVAADLDNDGDMDLVVADTDGGSVVWFENTDGLATFSTAIEIAIDFSVRQVIAVDIDGDGDIDVLSASPDQDRVIWYENLIITDTTTASSDVGDFAETPAPAEASMSPSTVAPIAVAPATVAPTLAEEAPTPIPVAATPAPSVPLAITDISEAPSGTLAPDMVSPPVESNSNTGGDDSSESKWQDAAWEIAVAVVGGVLVASISACTVTFVIRRRPEELARSIRSNSGVLDSDRGASTCQDSDTDSD